MFIIKYIFIVFCFKNFLSLPEWAQKVFVDGGNFEYLAEYWLKFSSGTVQLKRLKSGFLLKEILDRFKSKTLSTLTPDLLLYLYSGHDTTVANMLNSLGLFEVNSRYFFQLFYHFFL